MHRGYIKVWRKTFDSVIWQNQKLFRFWMYCLMKATHKPIKITIGFKVIELQPGQFIYGRKVASKETGLSEQTLRTCIEKLNGSKLTIKPTNKYTLVTINNWEAYQSEEKNQPANQPASNQQVTTYKNVKNVKNINNVASVKNIIAYLNQKTGKSFKVNTPNTVSSINARLRDGFTEDDFFKVIDNKCDNWLGDKEMELYLRPQTLFGTKFESYLNEKSTITKDRPII